MPRSNMHMYTRTHTHTHTHTSSSGTLLTPTQTLRREKGIDRWLLAYKASWREYLDVEDNGDGVVSQSDLAFAVRSGGLCEWRRGGEEERRGGEEGCPLCCLRVRACVLFCVCVCCRIECVFVGGWVGK